MKHLRSPLTTVVFALALPVLAGASRVSAQSADFTVDQRGHSVGTASYQFTPRNGGIDASSSVKVSMQGLDYTLSNTEQLGSDFHLQRAILSGLVNGSAANVIAKPDGAQFVLSMSANGRSSTARLAAHPASVFLPDFDPGALQTLLNLAQSGNNRDLWAIVPKQAGSIAAVQLATLPDEEGTWNSKPTAVHHLVATISGGETDLFASPDNQLLQAELPQEGFSLVRKGFVLTPPKKPIAPPVQPSAPTGQPNQPQPQ